jgi:hypothetical protein
MAQRYATVDEVRGLLGPAFDDPAVTDAQIQSVIDDQVCLLGLTAWGACASVGSKYLAAHCIALMHPEIQGGGQDGILAGEADGPANRSWAVSPVGAPDEFWGLTKWGLKYRELRKPVLGVGVLILGATSRTARP